MTLIETQNKFVRLVTRLFSWCFAQGYEITLGEAWRSPETAQLDAQEGKGISNSLHIIRLAIDLNVFVKGILLQTKDEYKPIGDFWKSLDPDCRWGGDFKRPDSDHFSITWLGVK